MSKIISSSQELKNLLQIEESTPHHSIEGIVWKLPDGKTHRLYGPAVDLVGGYKEWRVKGRLHRLDGPAIITSNGGMSYFVNGLEISEELFLSMPKKKA